MIPIPDARVLEMYNALRPNRSSREELLAIANELDTKYNAKITAAFVREAAEVYAQRDNRQEGTKRVSKKHGVHFVHHV